MPSDLGTWRNLSQNTLFGYHFGDFEEWAADWSLKLGGAAFADDAPSENRIAAARTRPPQEAPHIYLRERRARINKDDARGHHLALISTGGFGPSVGLERDYLYVGLYLGFLLSDFPIGD